MGRRAARSSRCADARAAAARGPALSRTHNPDLAKRRVLEQLAAFSDAFARGRDLAIQTHVLDAAQRAGLDRERVEVASSDPSIKQALREATDAAHALGVFGVPTLAVGGELFWGEDRLEDAAALVASR